MFHKKIVGLLSKLIYLRHIKFSSNNVGLQDPNLRPSFQKILEDLKTNEGFLTDDIDRDIFFDYASFIDEYNSTFQNGTRIYKIDKIVQNITDSSIVHEFSEHDTKEFFSHIVQTDLFNALPLLIQLFIQEITTQTAYQIYEFNINPKQVITLYQNDLLSNHDFCTLLKYFSSVSVIILYECYAYQFICERISELKLNYIPSLKVKFEISDITSPLVIVKWAISTCVNSIHFASSSTTFNGLLFPHFSALTEVILPSSLKEIPNKAFLNCTSLRDIKLPSSLSTIGSQAFENCESLEILELPSSLLSIGSSAFSNCKSLTTMTLPSSMSCFDDKLFFSCTNLSSIQIPYSVKSIGEFAFANCTSILSISLMSSTISIGQNTFNQCTGSFSWCTSLTEFEITDFC